MTCNYSALKQQTVWHDFNPNTG